jgi:hypothetical protein
VWILGTFWADLGVDFETILGLNLSQFWYQFCGQFLPVLCQFWGPILATDFGGQLSANFGGQFLA